MSLNRRAPRKGDNFTITDNATTNDDTISYRALGLLHYVLSKPLDWRADSETLSRGAGREGRDAVRSAMRELEKHGYLTRERTQNEKGHWLTETVWHEVPVPLDQRTHKEKSQVKPKTGNQSSATSSGNPQVAPETGNPSSVDSPATENPSSVPTPGKPASGFPAVGKPGALQRTVTKDSDKGGGSPRARTSLAPAADETSPDPTSDESHDRPPLRDAPVPALRHVEDALRGWLNAAERKAAQGRLDAGESTYTVIKELRAGREKDRRAAREVELRRAAGKVPQTAGVG